jgi:sugar phosphate isomerase/epimerase
MTANNTMVLTSYSLPHVMGYIPTVAGEKHPRPLGVIGLMDAAVELGMAGIEIPLPAPDVMSPEQLRDELQKRGLKIVIDAGAQFHGEVAMAREMLSAAKMLGATVVRDTISSVLCGDRRKLEGGWDAHLAKVAERLKSILPYAEEMGLAIAMENHQDATSSDLLRLSEMVGNSPAYGVTLDTGNPLAVGEGPVEYARRIAHLIRHVHCKDYTIHFSAEGYRLVRCAAGDGVVDFPAVLDIVRSNGHAILPGNEIAAQATRTIPLLDDTWWAEYPKAQSQYLVEALRVLWEKGRPVDEPYSTAWERGEDSAAVDAEEWDVLRRSAAYFSAL